VAGRVACTRAGGEFGGLGLCIGYKRAWTSAGGGDIGGDNGDAGLGEGDSEGADVKVNVFLLLLAPPRVGFRLEPGERWIRKLMNLLVSLVQNTLGCDSLLLQVVLTRASRVASRERALVISLSSVHPCMAR